MPYIGTRPLRRLTQAAAGPARPAAAPNPSGFVSQPGGAAKAPARADGVALIGDAARTAAPLGTAASASARAQQAWSTAGRPGATPETLFDGELVPFLASRLERLDVERLADELERTGRHRDAVLLYTLCARFDLAADIGDLVRSPA